MIEVYTGDGKGKTTAALGLAVRAVGGGLRVRMVQFLKYSDTGELRTAKRLAPDLEILRFDHGAKGFYWEMNEEQKQECRAEADDALAYARRCLREKACDVLILDEIFGCLQNGMISEEELLALIKETPQEIELVLTGRNAPEAITVCADYVSDIVCRKHPMDRGAPARKGIEF